MKPALVLAVCALVLASCGGKPKKPLSLTEQREALGYYEDVQNVKPGS